MGALYLGMEVLNRDLLFFERCVYVAHAFLGIKSFAMANWG